MDEDAGLCRKAGTAPYDVVVFFVSYSKKKKKKEEKEVDPDVAQ